MRFPPLAVFAVAFAAPALAAADPTAEEKAAMTALGKLPGVKTEIDPRLAEGARVSVKFDRATDAALAGLKTYPQVGAVDIADASLCSGSGFAALKELPNLRTLVVRQAPLTAAGVTAVGQCKELRHLVLLGCGVTDTGLANLKKLTLLEHLSLSENPGITDKGMATVKNFDRLQELFLSRTSISDKGLAELKPLDGLRRLYVKNTKVTGDAADKFADDMPNLRKVEW